MDILFSNSYTTNHSKGTRSEHYIVKKHLTYKLSPL